MTDFCWLEMLWRPQGKMPHPPSLFLLPHLWERTTSRENLGHLRVLANPLISRVSPAAPRAPTAKQRLPNQPTWMRVCLLHTQTHTAALMVWTCLIWHCQNVAPPITHSKYKDSQPAIWQEVSSRGQFLGLFCKFVWVFVYVCAYCNVS